MAKAATRNNAEMPSAIQVPSSCQSADMPSDLLCECNELRQLGLCRAAGQRLTSTLNAVADRVDHIGCIQGCTRIEQDNVLGSARLIVQHSAQHGHRLFGCFHAQGAVAG